MKEASYYKKLKNGNVQCLLCPKNCVIKKENYGFCNARKNIDGKLHSVVYSNPCAVHIDPIEKKPMYHYFPGEGILSIGSVGCNMACSFCQNAHISQNSVSSTYSLKQYTSAEIIDMAEAMNQTMIAYTYNEPVVFYEFMLDCARLAVSRGMKNVMVSNGFINENPLVELMELMDAFNIDLKAFDKDFYKDIALARLDPVLETIKRIVASGKHLELTFLVIPDLNDNAVRFKEMVKWIVDECGEDQVLHLSRYFPHHKLRKSSTPLATIEKFTEMARSKLKYVYPGNTGSSFDSSTYCHSCNELLIDRSMYTAKIEMDGGKCPGCGTEIPGIYK